MSSDVRGRVGCNCKMSGMPDLTLIFVNPHVVEDAAFHPCVRYGRWEREAVVSFVPPDGEFTLMNYKSADKNPTPPVFVRPTVSWRDGVGRVGFTLGTRAVSSTRGVSTASGGMSGGASADAAAPGVEDVVLTIVFPRAVKTVDVKADVGQVSVDPSTNDVTWRLPHLPKDRSPELTGSVYLAPGSTVPAPLEPVYATLNYSVPNATVSSLAVRDLTLANETYKFFRGVKTVLRSGRVTVRT